MKQQDEKYLKHAKKLTCCQLQLKFKRVFCLFWFLYYGHPMEDGRPLYFCPVVSIFLPFYLSFFSFLA